MLTTEELLKKVQKLAFRAKFVSEHLLAGQYHSHFRGKGMTFSEIRKYQYGDDVRAIDWNVTARYQELYLKLFQEERALNLLLIVDVSASMHMGTTTQTKRELAQEVAAVLALAAHQNNDQVGLILCSNQTEHFVPPQKGYQHVLRLIRDMLAHEPVQQQTNLATALQLGMQMVREKSIFCILSDFASSDYQSILRLTATRHEVLGIQISDVLERQLPAVGWLPVREVEQGRKAWIPSLRRSARIAYATAYAQHLAEMQETFRGCRAHLLHLYTGDDYIERLRKYFATR